MSGTGGPSGESAAGPRTVGAEGDREDDAQGHSDRAADPAEREFGWEGWFLVGVIAIAFVGAPGALLVLPQAQDALGALGLTLRDAYLVVPLVPAFALGAVAVWSAVRSRSG